MIFKTFAYAAALTVLTATSGFAATVQLNVVGGQLLGARNVDVDGTLYDVEFVDGSCIAVFDGCDSVSDFDFSTQALAVAAAKSLGDTVFLDGPLGNFDSDPTLTAGIDKDTIVVGSIVIPFAFSGNLDGFEGVSFLNFDGSDGLASSSAERGFDFSSDNRSTFARFTPSQIAAVPLPAGGLLLLAGLAGLGVLRTRRRTVAAH